MSEKDLKAHERAVELAYDLFEDHFADVVDHRRSASVAHRLPDILFITLCASIAGADNLKGIAEYAKDMEEWFSSFLELEHGIPSYATFWLVFKHLDPEPLSKCFTGWVQSVAKRCRGESIAIDGKAQRGTAQTYTATSFLRHRFGVN